MRDVNLVCLNFTGICLSFIFEKSWNLSLQQRQKVLDKGFCLKHFGLHFKEWNAYGDF